MSADAGTLERLIRFVGEALGTLADRLELAHAAALIQDLGLKPPVALLGTWVAYRGRPGRVRRRGARFSPC